MVTTACSLLGTEPSTDFRGMGLLGLEALSYVAKHHNDLAQRILRPRDDTYFYFYAIGGINIAATALRSVVSFSSAWRNLGCN